MGLKGTQSVAIIHVQRSESEGFVITTKCASMAMAMRREGALMRGWVCIVRECASVMIMSREGVAIYSQ
jgi:hypothetical protein